MSTNVTFSDPLVTEPGKGISSALVEEDKVSTKSAPKKKSTSINKIYNSNSSLNTRRQNLRTATKQVSISKAAASGIDEILRLTKIIDEQKALITKYMEELKTYRIVNIRQDKAINKLEKEQGSIPKVLHSLNEELRIAKSEKIKYYTKFMALEKSHTRQSNEISRLQSLLKESHSKLKEVQGVVDLKGENEKLKNELAQGTLKIEELSKKVKVLEGEKERESRALKANAAKSSSMIESLQSEISKLNLKLHEKDRLVMNLSVYSTHAAERKHLRSRTAEDAANPRSLLSKTPDPKRALNTFNSESQKNNNTNNNNTLTKHDYSNQPHPHTDALLDSILNKPKTQTIELKSSIHKPNFEVSKDSSGSKKSLKVDSVEDILARRMRESMMANSSSN